MRYELTDFEWAAIRSFLPNKPRGIPRVDDRRVLNGIFWVLRSGAPWRDLPETYGPRTTCYNRFFRWRQAGVWDRIMDALAAGHDAAVQMIDTSVVRVHQHGACNRGPFIVTEFVAHDSRLQFRSLNHVRGRAINPQWPVAGPLML
jgi:transposase